MRPIHARRAGGIANHGREARLNEIGLDASIARLQVSLRIESQASLRVGPSDCDHRSIARRCKSRGGRRLLSPAGQISFGDPRGVPIHTFNDWKEPAPLRSRDGGAWRYVRRNLIQPDADDGGQRSVCRLSLAMVLWSSRRSNVHRASFPGCCVASISTMTARS
jgi:hypothetical protein